MNYPQRRAILVPNHKLSRLDQPRCIMIGFSDPPFDIRLLIWLFIIAENEEEVCLCWPGDAPEYPGEQPLEHPPVLPLTVDTACPLGMHICRESRVVALNPSMGGVRLRASHVARCMTPFRCFRPELDVLYLDQESVFHLELLRAPLSHAAPLYKAWGTRTSPF